MATRKKATTKTRKTTSKVKKGKGKTITQAIYALFHKYGVENVTVEQATKAAQEVNPKTKFDKWHLYFHRRVFREKVAGGEIDYKAPAKTSKGSPSSPKPKAKAKVKSAPKKASTTKKKVVRRKKKPNM